MLLRIIYTSKAVPPLSFDELLRESRTNNARVEITGGLAMLDGVFLQYLEGEQVEVLALAHRLERDKRHAGFKILEQRAVSRRMFADWQMALLDWNYETETIFRSFSPGKKLSLYDTDADTAAPLFRAWAATGYWKNSAQYWE